MKICPYCNEEIKDKEPEVAMSDFKWAVAEVQTYTTGSEDYHAECYADAMSELLIEMR